MNKTELIQMRARYIYEHTHPFISMEWEELTDTEKEVSIIEATEEVDWFLDMGFGLKGDSDYYDAAKYYWIPIEDK